LAVAAALKGYELFAAPPSETSLWTSRGFRIAVIEAELVLGLWLLSGLWRRGARWAALVAFHVFFIVSLSKALAGEADCGCFGRPVSPRWTAALDLAAILALWRWRPAETEGWLLRGPWLRAAVLLILALLVGIPGGIVLAVSGPAVLDGETDVNAPRVLLKPERWAGRRCPLLPYTDLGEELSHGRWLVVLYHHDCLRCREVVPVYEEMARTAAADPAAPRIAFLAVPPYGTPVWQFAPRSSCRHGRLNEGKEWFVTTPAVIRLQDGVVESDTAH
jgi:hypothetical protein